MELDPTGLEQSIGIEQQIAAAKRELAMRKTVYANKRRDGRMTEEAMARGLAEMQAILDTLQRLAPPAPQQSLFA